MTDKPRPWMIGVIAAAIVGIVQAHAAAILPDFGAATFNGSSSTLTNPFFPYAPGQAFRYLVEAVDPDSGETEDILVEVLDQVRVVAGVDGALPGYIMPADRPIGFRYYQEYYVGEAEDHAEILSVDDRYTLSALDPFDDLVRTRDFTLDPEDLEEKLYAPGIGPIAEFEFDGDGRIIGTSELIAIVPEPGTVTLLCMGGALILARSRRHSRS